MDAAPNAADQDQEAEDAAMVLSLTSSSDSLTEEDLFEPVSLRDLNNADEPYSPSASDPKTSSSTNSPRSFPRPRPRRKLSISDTPPEILHLVDSAIMGSSESLETLQLWVAEAGDDVSRPLVDALINTMGGAEGLDDMGIDPVPSIMKNSTAAVIAVELIPFLQCGGKESGSFYMSPRTRMVRGLLTILRSCTRNRVMCTGSGLLRLLLVTAEEMFVKSSGDRGKWDFSPLFQCIMVLGGHSLSVIDLHHWLGVLKRSLTTEWALPLILALEKAVGSKEARGPACSFEFDGERSGLIAPRETRWPFQNGYAFATWIYMESFADAITMAEDGVNMPRLFSYLFSFLASDNYGIEAYFHGQFLVVETCTGKGKKTSVHFSYLFQPRCWYFVGLEHEYKQVLLGKEESELRLYVDGHLHETRPFEFPRISKPLACSCIGTNPPPRMAGLQRRRRQCPLFGEMGPVYIFKESIGLERMTRLASRGADYLPTFGSGAGLPWLAVNEHVRELAEDSAKLDAEIGGSLHLLYHPKLLRGRSCPDASPFGAPGWQCFVLNVSLPFQMR